MPAAIASVMEAAPAERAGLASGTLNAARQVGGVVGVVLLRTLRTLVAQRSAFVGGLRVAVGIAAAAFAPAAVLTGAAVAPTRPNVR